MSNNQEQEKTKAERALELLENFTKLTPAMDSLSLFQYLVIEVLMKEDFTPKVKDEILVLVLDFKFLCEGVRNLDLPMLENG